ncbi:diacylglycerol/lipid kinase family protein [Microaceticoccus formicicus]|uniref:diacylglycerol/lipid kinase family protein n=1 Tax=Microaceticoccus formicicus TaxID=3118105 RepID=UPI003CD00334|nr:diacylglycerol kinase family protein [Peptoniphilaceae bacterium AMB_02]
MQRKILFIINPIAGSGRALNYREKIADYLNGTDIKYEIVLTESSGHATEIAKATAFEDFDTVVAVGGDGTVKEVAKGLAFGDVRLGIMPAGTGNDAVKSLNISRNFEESMYSIIYGEEKLVDIGIAGENIFLNVLSVGFDAEVVKYTDMVKKHIKGKFAYYLGLIMAFTRYKNKELEIYAEEGRYKGGVLLAAIGNGNYYGGGFNILPLAEMNDGLLDVCIGNDMSKISIIRIFIELLKGVHLENREKVVYFRAKSVTIKPKDYIELNIDGEISLLKEELNVIIKRDALKIIV